MHHSAAELVYQLCFNCFDPILCVHFSLFLFQLFGINWLKSITKSSVFPNLSQQSLLTDFFIPLLSFADLFIQGRLFSSSSFTSEYYLQQCQDQLDRENFEIRNWPLTHFKERAHIHFLYWVACFYHSFWCSYAQYPPVFLPVHYHSGTWSPSTVGWSYLFSLF